MSIVDFSDLAEFNAFRELNKPAFLFFWADWHEPSKVGGPIRSVFGALSQKYPDVTFIRVEAEKAGEISELCDISLVPTFVAIHGMHVVGKMEGAVPSDMGKLIKQLVAYSANPTTVFSSFTSAATTTVNDAVPSAHAETASPDPAVLEKRLNSLIRSGPVTAFIKGTPDAPRCGFTRQLIEILNENKINFASFDILQDEEVRAGLKKLSDWPTYPQLYVNGEFVGGLDIIKEMAKEDLRTQLSIPTVEAIDAVVSASSVENLNGRLHALTHQAAVMCFVKGTVQEPRCGFSKQLNELLTNAGVVYETFNILEDEEVRAGLKKFSDWPTYPQVYVKGELIGGLDILKEMAKDSISLQSQFDAMNKDVV